MNIDLTVKNYRCFSESKPLRLCLRSGFTGFIGVNNSGKSSLLRFFYEFRNLFFAAHTHTHEFARALSGSPHGFGFPPFVFDPQTDVFSNANDRDLTIELRLTFSPGEKPRNPHLAPKCVTIRIPRGTNGYLAKLEMDARVLSVPGSGVSIENGLLAASGSGTQADLSEFLEAFKTLADTLYIPAFRNSLNVGGKQDYYDISIGQLFIQAWDNYKTGSYKRFNEVAHRVEADIRRIFGYESLQINPAPNNENLQLLAARV
jgi:hypothetical protein